MTPTKRDYDKLFGRNVRLTMALADCIDALERTAPPKGGWTSFVIKKAKKALRS